MIRDKKIHQFIFTLILVIVFTGCESSETETDNTLKNLIQSYHLSGNALEGKVIPNISDETTQLGMRLFFSKSLGGDRDSACVSCHHPLLGAGDNLSLPIGVGAENPDLLGIGRLHSSASPHYDAGPTVARNAPTTFNLAGWNKVLFHDGRIETVSNGIRTPDSPLHTADPLAGDTLTVAQSRFPLTSPEEMKGFKHNDKNNQEIREYIASRIGNYGLGAGELAESDYWLAQFRTAFQSPNASKEILITEQNIALLLGEYELSQAFTNTPWRRYIEGNNNAISKEAKEGAVLFYTSIAEGGANCVGCHSGDLFSDEGFHNIAMPQIGRGKGDGSNGSADFGRFRETGLLDDKYAFRTPSLLNVEVTGPWNHSGSYTTLESVVKHHLNPSLALHNYSASQLTQTGIQNLDKIQTNTQPALEKLLSDRNFNKDVIQDVELTQIQINQIIDFLYTLTDPCVKDKSCISQWIPPLSEDPNGDQVDAVDENDKKL